MVERPPWPQGGKADWGSSSQAAKLAALLLARAPFVQCSTAVLAGAALVEGGHDGHQDEDEAEHIVPAQLFTKHGHGENGEDDQGDDFLDDLELKAGELSIPPPVRRDLRAVFKEGDAPRNEDDEEQRFACSIFEMAIPGEGHEDVEQANRCSSSSSFRGASPSLNTARRSLRTGGGMESSPAF